MNILKRIISLTIWLISGSLLGVILCLIWIIFGLVLSLEAGLSQYFVLMVNSGIFNGTLLFAAIYSQIEFNDSLNKVKLSKDFFISALEGFLVLFVEFKYLFYGYFIGLACGIISIAMLSILNRHAQLPLYITSRLDIIAKIMIIVTISCGLTYMQLKRLKNPSDPAGSVKK